MDLETFKAAIEAGGGESQVISIGFDNNTIVKFVDPVNPDGYKHSLHLLEDIRCLKFYERDLIGNMFIVLKPLDTVQTISFACPGVPRAIYENQSLG